MRHHGHSQHNICRGRTANQGFARHRLIRRRLRRYARAGSGRVGDIGASLRRSGPHTFLLGRMREQPRRSLPPWEARTCGTVPRTPGIRALLSDHPAGYACRNSGPRSAVSASGSPPPVASPVATDRPEPAVPLLPAGECLLGNPHRADDLGHRCAGLCPVERKSDLLFRVPRLLQVPGPWPQTSKDWQNLAQIGLKNKGMSKR